MDRLLSLREACQIMNVSYGKGQRLAAQGQLGFRKLGASWVVPLSVLAKELRLQPPIEIEKEYARTK